MSKKDEHYSTTIAMLGQVSVASRVLGVLGVLFAWPASFGFQRHLVLSRPLKEWVEGRGINGNVHCVAMAAIGARGSIFGWELNLFSPCFLHVSGIGIWGFSSRRLNHAVEYASASA
ncbi:hypothetical protein B0T20DRAFT_395171 [Sordaria brevicollis]|uniref:Uncharacterized protein n=1 Tax=Sordaria brevicollis TaxID=83679 RepID=A0AAE0PBQ3_SORBR|nr:hypothetical protein B0T20DRAFT_395171 [Sordaria brevicollis]